MEYGIRERIVRTAIMLFGRYGYDNVAMRQIAFDAGITAAVLQRQFAGKEELMHSVLEYITQSVVHYEPTRRELEKSLEREPPADVLFRYCTFYDWDFESLCQDIYRLFYLERFRGDHISQTLYSHLFLRPTGNVQWALDQMVRLGAVPPCDTRAIAELWNRTAQIVAMLYTCGKHALGQETYYKLIRFIIQIIVRGVRVVPVDQIEMTWTARQFFQEWDLEASGARERIMLKALDLFGEKGYSRVTVRQIAQEIGIGVSSLYKHFQSKEDLMGSLIQLILNAYERFSPDNPGFEAVLASREPEQIILTLATTYPPIRGNYARKLYRILFREQYLSQELQNLFADTINRDQRAVRTTLDKMIQAGRIPPGDSDSIAILYVYSMCSMTIDATTAPTTDDPELEQLRRRVVALTTSLVMRGFADQTEN